MEDNSEKFSLKDHLFNKQKVEYLGNLIKKVYPEFNNINFVKDVLNEFPELELKERIRCVSKNIDKYLPNDYYTSLDILLDSLKDKSIKENFLFLTFSDYVDLKGCNKKYLERSLYALGEFTKYCSSEFAIRKFINEFPEETFTIMQKWSVSNNVHLRRLASEGIRPKLPWAPAISFDYKKAAMLLDNLYYDSERYVTRSVANHLNDISKIDPDFVLNKLKTWRDLKKQTDKEIEYIISHSSRTLIKKGHSKTLMFLGYDPDPGIKIRNFKLEEKEIFLGDKLKFSFNIISESDQKLIIDYKVIYAMPNGRNSEKVFKLKNYKIKKGEELIIIKNHLFKSMTTKKLYEGKYKIVLQINGKLFNNIDFLLKV